MRARVHQEESEQRHFWRRPHKVYRSRSASKSTFNLDHEVNRSGTNMACCTTRMRNLDVERWPTSVKSIMNRPYPPTRAWRLEEEGSRPTSLRQMLADPVEGGFNESPLLMAQ